MIKAKSYSPTCLIKFNIINEKRKLQRERKLLYKQIKQSKQPNTRKLQRLEKIEEVLNPEPQDPLLDNTDEIINESLQRLDSDESDNYIDFSNQSDEEYETSDYSESDEEYETSDYSESDQESEYMNLYNRNGIRTLTQDEYCSILRNVKNQRVILMFEPGEGQNCTVNRVPFGHTYFTIGTNLNDSNNDEQEAKQYNEAYSKLFEEAWQFVNQPKSNIKFLSKKSNE